MEIKLSELTRKDAQPLIQAFEDKELKGKRVDLLWEHPNSFIEAYIIKGQVFVPTEFHPLYLWVGKIKSCRYDELDKRIKDRIIEIELCPQEFKKRVGRLPKDQEEFDKWCDIVKKGLFNGHIDWDILYDCASEGFEKGKGEQK